VRQAGELQEGRGLQTANHHKPPQTTTNTHKPPQTENHHKLPRTTTNIHKPPQTANHHKPPQTTTNHCKPPKTTTNHHKSQQTPTNHHKPGSWWPIQRFANATVAVSDAAGGARVSGGVSATRRCRPWAWWSSRCGVVTEAEQRPRWGQAVARELTHRFALSFCVRRLAALKTTGCGGGVAWLPRVFEFIILLPTRVTWLCGISTTQERVVQECGGFPSPRRAPRDSFARLLFLLECTLLGPFLPASLFLFFHGG